MAKRTGEDDLTSLWPTLRAIRGWKQEDVAAAAGLWPSTISDVEQGKTSPQAPTRAKLANGFGLPVAWLEPLALLLRVLRARMESPERPRAKAEESLLTAEAWAAQAGKEVEEFLVPVLALLQVDLEEAFQAAPRSEAPASPPGESLAGAALWERLEPYTLAQQRAVVQELEEFQSWPLCEFLCAASASVASDSADWAVQLADLACRIAERIPGDEKERSRRQGYAGCFLANALRVQGSLPAAGETFDRALANLEAGASAAFPQLDEVRLLDLEASLRRDQRRLERSLELLDRARALENGGSRTGRILIMKAKTLEELNDSQGALALLLEARPFVEASCSQRLILVHRFNTLVYLADLGRHAEAEAGLPEVQALTAELGNDLDGVRLRWLEARIAAGLGRIDEAIRGFFWVRDRFAAKQIAWDTALVTLELAALLAEEGRTAEVKTLALQTERIFKAQQVERERLGALRLFCGAARKERLTAALARELLADLRKGGASG